MGYDYPSNGKDRLLWSFRLLTALNVLLLATTLLYHSPGEDHAGAGLRLVFSLAYALGLAILLLAYRLVRARWARAIALGLMTIPAALLAYGIWLSA